MHNLITARRGSKNFNGYQVVIIFEIKESIRIFILASVPTQFFSNKGILPAAMPFLSIILAN